MSSRRARRRERLKRRLRRLAVALATVLLCAATLLYYFPLRSTALQRRIERDLSRSLGRPVALGDLFIYVFQNQIVVHDVSIHPAPSEAPAPAFRIRKIVFRAPVMSLPLRGAGAIERVEVYEPDEVAAAFDRSHAFSARGVPGRMLEDYLRRARPRSAEPESAARPILPFNVAVFNGRLTLEAAQWPVSPLTVRLTQGTLRGNRFGDLSTFMQGFLIYGNTLTPFTVDLSYRRAGEAVDGRVHLPGELALDWLGRAGGSSASAPAQASGLTLQFQRRGAADQRVFDVSLEAAGARFPLPAGGAFEDRGLRARVQFAAPTGRSSPLVIDPLQWESRLGRFEGRLTLHPAAPTTFTLEVARAQVGRALVHEALGWIGRQGAGLTFDDRRTSASFSGWAFGTWRTGIQDARGRWALTGLEVAAPGWPTPLRLRRAEGGFDAGGYHITRLEIEGLDAVLEGRGSVEAEAFRPRRAHVQWDVLTGLQGAAPWLEALAGRSAQPFTLTGSVRTRGWATLPLPPPARPWDAADFDVSIFPENAAIEARDGGWRGSLVGGQLHARPAALEVRDVRLRLFDDILQVRGAVTGDRRFWEHPQASLRIEGTLPVGDVLAQLGRLRGGQPSPVAGSGRAPFQLEISGRLDSPGDLYWQAQGRLDGATLSFPAHPSLQNITRMEGRWIVSRDLLQVQALNGQWGPFPFAAQGRATPRDLMLNVESALALEDFAGRIPELQRKYILFGAARVRATLSCAIPPDAAVTAPTAPDPQSAGRLAHDIRRAALYLISVADAEARRPLPVLQSPLLDLRGTLQVRDGGFGHVSMPAIISRIEADMEWENHRLTWTDGWGMAGRSAIVTGPCSIDLSGPTPHLHFTGRMEEFDLNQWLTDWPDTHTTETLRADEASSRTLLMIDCEATAQNVKLYKYTLGAFSGRLHYEKWKGAPNRLHFTADCGRVFGGRGQAQGDLEIRHGGHRPILNLTMAVQDVSLERYLSEVSPAHSGIRGTLQARTTLQGETGRSGSLQGQGAFAISDSQFLRFPIFEALADLTGMESFRQASFSRIEGEFFIRDGRVHFSRITCNNPLVKLNASGWVDFNENIAFDLSLSYFRALGQSLPPLAGIMEKLDALIQLTVKLEVTGTLNQPVMKVKWL
ncbi:MAG: hypothetical protein Kow0059_04740 [Candidatus Sumerlaeia bacterium]